MNPYEASDPSLSKKSIRLAPLQPASTRVLKRPPPLRKPSRVPSTSSTPSTASGLEQTGFFPNYDEVNKSKSFGNEENGRYSFPPCAPESPRKAWWKQTSVLRQAHSKRLSSADAQFPTKNTKKHWNEIQYLSEVCKHLLEEQQELKEKIRKQDLVLKEVSPQKKLLDRRCKVSSMEPPSPSLDLCATFGSQDWNIQRRSKFPRKIFSPKKQRLFN